MLKYSSKKLQNFPKYEENSNCFCFHSRGVSFCGIHESFKKYELLGKFFKKGNIFSIYLQPTGNSVVYMIRTQLMLDGASNR